MGPPLNRISHSISSRHLLGGAGLRGLAGDVALIWGEAQGAITSLSCHPNSQAQRTTPGLFPRLCRGGQAAPSPPLMCPVSRKWVVAGRSFVYHRYSAGTSGIVWPTSCIWDLKYAHSLRLIAGREGLYQRFLEVHLPPYGLQVREEFLLPPLPLPRDTVQ